MLFNVEVMETEHHRKWVRIEAESAEEAVAKAEIPYKWDGVDSGFGQEALTAEVIDDECE